MPEIDLKNSDMLTAFGRVALTGNPERFETFVKSIDAWLAMSVYSVRHGYVAVLFDNITSRKKTEETLRLFKALVERSTDAIGISSPEGRHYYQNRAFDDMFGDIGPNPVGTLYVDETVGETVFGTIMEGGSWQGEIEAYAKDGRTLSIFLRAYAIKDHDGRIIGLAGLHNDITAQKQAEEEKARLQQQLYQSQKMEYVGRLAGGVAHDFNNMLGVILGHLDLIMDGMAPENPLIDELMEIRKAGERSADLTRQLLAFARKQTASPKVIDLNETVESLLKMIRRLIGEDIDLIWTPGTHLRPVKIDPSQIDQMMVNLCLNARDAIGGVGTITIETAAETLDEHDTGRYPEGVPGDYVTLEIRDNGCGMDPTTRDQIFEPFFTTKILGKGTGLGLSTVYGMVRQNKGFIDVVSEPDQGTTFRIFLPCHEGSDVEKTVPVSVNDPVGGHETILVVEDEEAILEMITLMLTPLGYTVISAARPEDAITLARSHQGGINLLITDVIMPGMNGRDLARVIAKEAPALKCLFMSGYTADVIGQHGVLDRRVHFIQKPFSRKTLSLKVRSALDEP
jgi:PAS domain S-box-containing protein